MLLYAEGAVIRPLSVPIADLGDVDRSPLLDCFFLAISNQIFKFLVGVYSGSIFDAPTFSGHLSV